MHYYLEFKKNCSYKIHTQRCKNVYSDIDSIITNKFYKIHNGNKVLHIFQKKHKVPDVWRYNLKINSDSTIIKSFLPYYEKKSVKKSVYTDRYIPTNDLTNNVILLLLESPHRDEYILKKNKLSPIAPAQGNTGCDINRHIKEAMGNMSLPEGSYSLLIINPVPYITSLGAFYTRKLEKNIRNRIWETLWSIPAVQDDFLKRCLSYNPSYILNCCTSQGSASGLQSKVSSLLIQHASSFSSSLIVFSGKHPAINWNNKKFSITQIHP